MNKQYDNVSEKSLGEFMGAKEFDKIEEEVRRKRQQKQKQEIQSKPKDFIDMNKLGPFLSHISQVSNHNLAVATNYQLLLQQAQQTLIQEREKLFKTEEELQNINRKYEMHTTQLKNQLGQLQNEHEDVLKENQSLKTESQLYNQSLQEKNQTIQDKKNLIVSLQDSFKIKEVEIQNFRQQKILDDIKIQQINDELNQFTLLNGEYERLQRQLDDLKKFHDKQIVELKAEKDHFQGLMLVEIRQKEAFLQQQEPLRKEKEILKQYLDKASQEIDHLKKELLKLQDQLKMLTINYSQRLKVELNDFQVTNIERIVSLEKQNHDATKKSVILENQNQNINIELQEKNAEIEFYVREYKGMDEAISKMKEEKEIYLQEFQKLKLKYEKCIEDLQVALRKKQLDFIKTEDELRTSQMHLNRQVQKMEDMLSMQKLFTIGDQYMQDQAKKEAMTDFMKSQTQKNYEKQTESLNINVDEYFKKELEIKQQEFDQDDNQFEDEWKKLYDNINSIENKIENQ